jgi:hypothetical protein
MLSKMEMDSTAMQATISDDMLEVLTRVVITNRKGGGGGGGKRKEIPRKSGRVEELTIVLMSSKNPTS